MNRHPNFRRRQNALFRPMILAIAIAVPPAVAPLEADTTQRMDLAGPWSLRLDPQDQGIEQRWFRQSLPEKIALPGSLPYHGFGNVPRLDTPWTGSIRPEVIRMPRYAPYRDPDNFKMPFWLQPRRHYVGPAWYQRDVQIPASWAARRITLHLERCHWFTQVWVDDRPAGAGNSLSVPHELDLTDELSPGRHRLTIRVDNRVRIPVGQNSHSVTDHTQTNWNGIIGEIHLRAEPLVHIANLQVYPDLDTPSADVAVVVRNHSGQPRDVQLCLTAFQDEEPLATAGKSIHLEGDVTQHTITLRMPPTVKRWSEHAPHLCRLEATLHDAADPARIMQRKVVSFGMREISVEGTQFQLNGRPISLRGTLECCIFPLTGFPPTDVDSWKRIVRRCKQFGLNHIRFHSWCPPKAAFVAADQLGFYYQVECASWANGDASLGNGLPVDQWLYDEADRILKAYGNHPSFLLLAYGNEPAGPGPRGQGEQYLSKWVNHYKRLVSRQIVTGGSGWPYIDQNEYHVMHRPLRQHRLFNREEPATLNDYGQHVREYDVPLISHETGQWCVFPNLEEMSRYTGVLQAKNFEIVRDFLRTNHLLDQARAFLMASGALQTQLYKEEIEVMLRTPGLGGFQLLDLHDFPGQGTALIGLLDPFWDPKPYINADQFRRFCGPVVPLARLASRTWTSDQTFTAQIEVYQFGPDDLSNQSVAWKLIDDDGRIVGKGELPPLDLPRGALHRVGQLQVPLARVEKAAQLTLSVSLPGTPYRNDWKIWVYPTQLPAPQPDGVLVARSLDAAARAQLESGGKLLLLPATHSVKGNTYGSFESIFWNRLWFPTQPVHTLGILCDPAHPALDHFPTPSHSDWQWWDLCVRSKPMDLTHLSPELTPIVQVIDDWNTCRRLGLVWEASVGSGKLLMCSIDLARDLNQRPAARQLRHSLINYVASDAFAPQIHLTLAAVQQLLREPTTLQRIDAEIQASSHQPGYEAANAMDNNPSTIWHTAWGEDAANHPHELIIDLRETRRIAGLSYLPRQDMSNGRVARYAIYTSNDQSDWGSPVAQGVWPDTKSRKRILFEEPVSARYIKLESRREVHDQPFTSAAEIDVTLAKDDAGGSGRSSDSP